MEFSIQLSATFQLFSSRSLASHFAAVLQVIFCPSTRAVFYYYYHHYTLIGSFFPHSPPFIHLFTGLSLAIQLYSRHSFAVFSKFPAILLHFFSHFPAILLLFFSHSAVFLLLFSDILQPLSCNSPVSAQPRDAAALRRTRPSITVMSLLSCRTAVAKMAIL